MISIIILFVARISMEQDSHSSHPLSEEQKLISGLPCNLWQTIPHNTDNQHLPLPIDPIVNGKKSTQKKINQTQKSHRRGKKSLEEAKQVNRGHWSLEENKRYHWFLELHHQHFVNSHMRRTDKIFKTMQQFIGSRQAEQCRSHHQKMQKKYLNFPAILSSLRQSHYNTLSTAPIHQQMASLGIKVEEDLPSIQKLTLITQNQNQPEQKVVKRRIPKIMKNQQKQNQRLPANLPSQPSLEEEKEEKEKEEEMHHINMFEECHHHHLGDFSLHLKEDSYPLAFPSLFHHPQ